MNLVSHNNVRTWHRSLRNARSRTRAYPLRGQSWPASLSIHQHFVKTNILYTTVGAATTPFNTPSFSISKLRSTCALCASGVLSLIGVSSPRRWSWMVHDVSVIGGHAWLAPSEAPELVQKRGSVLEQEALKLFHRKRKKNIRARKKNIRATGWARAMLMCQKLRIR